MAKKPTMLTAREVAERIGAAESSVRMWARSGRFPGAQLQETPVGSYWLIPDTALGQFEMRKAGRPPKTEKASKKGKGKK